ncbi:hypothetical protein ONS95_003246 [Cadophora gregata]|uniref:uncharacterized protein n=1 Tax=Cadophora gregata TaxID=51156 RepID=UPI0026DDA69D|nr:uncharacterized protein ONS95_003246 [Cadophora gregata]KAK0108443.1 hypothetical protein ONS95_003246 [Cadophora gregata]KAK0108964.1 hypothetical protein ONS96_002802 [Cadophora gregata f. sp. sojae]
MARLNEPAAAPTETIESLKRKFMRQNRDIARANSTQSLRIRNLENETSRLLAENLGLRGQILQLQGELENGRSQRIAQHTGVLKSQLEAKLLEIGALLSGIGEVPSPQRKSRQSGRISRTSPTTSLDHKNWKNICSLSEAVAGGEGRLPPILENKSYPRRTLEHQEIVNLVANTETDITDSPEIGPPPVSQFVDEDPVKIDLPLRTKKEDSEENTDLDPALSINLEQRRKRKESTSVEPRRMGKPESTPDIGEASGPLKTGAKRKLNVRDDEEPISSRNRPSSPDDFKYTRVTNDDKSKNKTLAKTEKVSNRSTRELAIARGAPRDKVTAISNRKILAPKSVNDSPRKKVLATDETKVNKSDHRKLESLKDRAREKKREKVCAQPSPDPVLDTIEIQPEPETPAAIADFSPESSQPPSTARVESRDTPPPSDLGTSGEAQRPSRRARGSVSYAEPSLRDKMRRPTKDLVDAVVPGQKSRSIMKQEEPNTVTLTIKAEPEADDAWKSMPAASSATVENSPLRNKNPGLELLPSSITTHRKRRESILNQTEPDASQTTSGSAIAALLAETRRVKAAAREKEKTSDKEAVLTKSMANLDIYEFRGSSPSSAAAPQLMTREDKAPIRVSRRHSTLSRDHPQQSDSEASDMEATKRSDSATSRRRQSTLGLRASSSDMATMKEREEDRSLKRSSSTNGMVDPGVGASRSDRISARRRSMML